MPFPEPLVLAGSVVGFLGVTYATFTAVSYAELKNKIDEQVARGEDPYELRTSEQQRAKPAQKRKKAPKRK